jgi:two-component system, NtrC family, sensor kinase
LRPSRRAFPTRSPANNSTTVPPSPQPADPPNWQLAAEAIAVRVRWFGLVLGYVLVNVAGREHEGSVTDQIVLNAILSLGLAYTVVDTFYSSRGKIVLSEAPLAISLMEAVFIGLLCHFDAGIGSPFRAYYFLSLLVSAFRYPPRVTLVTFAFHTLSYGTLVLTHPRATGGDDLETFLFMLVLMGWGAWASTALAGLVQRTSRRLAEVNAELERNQNVLEERIAERTRELQESQALLVQQEKQAAFGLLAAGIAHEVGNPLAAISSLVQMLRRRDTDDYVRERHRMIDEQLARIQRTLRELVDFGRPANPEENLVHVETVVDGALSIAKYYKRKKGKRIVTDYAEGLPRIRVVRDALVQVVLNLVLNALDATREGGTLTLRTRQIEGWVEIAVTDDGPGIDADHQPLVFEPYFTTKPTGTGLGLFVCRHLLEQSGRGRIELTESTAAGTTFTIGIRCE